MFVFDTRGERIALFAMTVLMAATRIDHFGAGHLAPDASTAVFFLAGLLIGNPLWFVAFLAEAFLLDLAAIKVVGVESVCVTTGYGMMIPAYASLWLAGRLVRMTDKLDAFSIAKLVGACCGGLVAFFVFSNIGYYFGGGFEDSMGVAEYARRVVRYFPDYLTSTLAYSAIGVAIAILAAHLAPRNRLVSR
ncbi:MAG TPA: hypothetical protein VKT73_06055 [Xanthobacteraceae bacterium]|nr:hypothetical protein [Xanthobacteraceae bacterium]